MMYPRLAYRTPEETRNAALRHFIEKFTYEYAEIPEVADAAGMARFAKYRLRDFLKELLEDT